jgi:hypothetical protein
MKTLAITLIAGLISAQAWAGTIPEGHFKGDGLWKSASKRGRYTVETTVSKNTINTDYTLPDGVKKQWNFEMAPTKNGLFKVTVFGAEIGQGYCLEKVELCHYEIKVSGFTLEETLTVQDGTLYRFGSKDDGSGRIVWQEALEK